jgi:hypothetical protein
MGLVGVTAKQPPLEAGGVIVGDKVKISLDVAAMRPLT